MEISVIVPTMNRAGEVINCVNSILESTFDDFEIIVVDNGSSDDTVSRLNQSFGNNSKVQILQSKTNLWAWWGRNLWAKNASWKYLLFVDSDNVIDKDMIKHLFEFFEKTAECWMVGPIMYFKDKPDMIWVYFADINMWSSQAMYKWGWEIDQKQYKEVEQVGHLPNCFMVKKDDFVQVWGFDEKYIVMFEEADLAEKLKKLGKKIFTYTKAKTYHDVPLPNSEGIDRSFFRDSKRAFLTARNRVYFMRRNANFKQKIVFFLVFNPLIMLYYQFQLLKKWEFAKAWNYLKWNVLWFFM